MPLTISATVARRLIALGAVLLAVGGQWPHSGLAWSSADEWLRDQLIRRQASAATEQRLAVIDIDETSLAAAGPWPWPRERIATMIEQLLGDYGARGVALDLVLPEPSDAGGDARLAMLSQHGPLVLPQAFDYNGNMPLRVGRLTGGAAAASAGAAVPASGYIANHAGLAQAAHIGNIGFVPDQDGVIRRLPMQTWFDGRTFPTLSLALLDCCSASKPSASGPTGGMQLGDGLRRLPYRLQWDAYKVIPASMILDLSAPDELLRGKLVLIGSSSLGLADRVATPLSASTSGLLVHAAALTAQLDARAGLAPSAWPGRLIAMLFSSATIALCFWTLPRKSALVNVGVLAAASLLWLALAWQMAPHDALFGLSAPLLANAFLLAVGVPFAWQQSQRQSRRLLDTLRQYVADAVVDELLRNNLLDPLKPSHCDVTTLIADMQGYTSHVGALPLEQAAELTRAFLDCLTGPVLAAHGTLDKFTGDGLVAFWGAPLPVRDHADQALDAAAAIQAGMVEFNAARARQGLAPIRVRIGIESGRAMAGDFGSAARSIYTAVGDSVNVASRLETAARDLPHDVIIGPGTAALCRRHQLRHIGELTLRGKEHPTTLYTLLAPAPQQGVL
ncbi:adenylate/guanylate cyclase domain-containing protein [Duganella sp. sic0402]|uniref:CHASE2 domain-containing protein n=1 Tax=Duganella sp. sic0402 TaxID=2854786 RepID=UPI001C451679|nr:adenylate/guanylate cyclase domain-containing protein [Duganella sp. sic0402]MBV7537498.1 adenylate/guanylate cyclase domain-containing protein [Duganella sp. sic0402]